MFKRLIPTASRFLMSFRASHRFSTVPAYEKHCKVFSDLPENYTTKLTVEQDLNLQKPFRLLDLQGKLIDKESWTKVDENILLKIYEIMLKTDAMDNILYMAQRQGKISFYMPSFGEGASVIASAAALHDTDLIFPQYREQGSLLWRGFSIQECVHQCVGNHLDKGKGRQMPVHYGCKELNYVTISSCLTTQVPQAAGAGYAFNLNKEPRVAVTYFGEGAASEGDFHAALNFASTLDCQTMFICRNNHYAISTPIADQFKSDISSRGKGYGMAALKIDGNDALAVFQGVARAREYIIKNKAPVLIELMTYRVGDHSTSDHSVLYREEEELKSWTVNNNPITRLGKFLEEYSQTGFKQASFEEKLRKKYREETIQALKNAINEKYPPVEDLFTDVYDELTPNLKEQMAELKEHLQKYGEHYNLDKYKPN